MEKHHQNKSNQEIISMGMFKKIILTFSTKFITALLNFLIVIITARYLGAEGRGTISLIVLGISINLIVNDIIGGSALVYLTPRINLFKLFVPSYIWALTSSSILTYCLCYFKLIPVEYYLDVFLLSVLQSLGSINFAILLGQERIKQHNAINILQILLLFISLLVILFVFNYQTVSAYIYSLYIGLGFSFAVSLTLIFKHIKPTLFSDWKEVIKSILENSIYIQLANILQIFNYRISYYILNWFTGAKILGVYSTAVSVAEAVWLVSKSIAMVQYARISNSTDKNYSRQLTIQLSKFSLLATIITLLPLLLLPDSIFILIFGIEFSAIHQVLIYLSIGIISIGFSTIYTHYFSGIGKYHINSIASGIGFIFTILFCIILIPKYQLSGAAISASLSYSATSIYLLIAFIKETKLKPSELIPSSKDFSFLMRELKKLLNT